MSEVVIGPRVGGGGGGGGEGTSAPSVNDHDKMSVTSCCAHQPMYYCIMATSVRYTQLPHSPLCPLLNPGSATVKLFYRLCIYLNFFYKKKGGGGAKEEKKSHALSPFP